MDNHLLLAGAAFLFVAAIFAVGLRVLKPDTIKDLLLQGRGAAIFAVTLLAILSMITMIADPSLGERLEKVLLVLVGALAGLLGHNAKT